MIYSQWVNYLCDIFKVPAVDPTSEGPTGNVNFNNILPAAIDYTELRMLRDPDLDFLAAYTTQNATASAVNRVVTKPAAIIVPVEVNYLPSAGGQVPLQMVSHAYMNAAWGSTATGAPVCWSPLNDVSILLGPIPDQAYTLGVYGTSRPAELSSTNTSNFLTLNFPDLYLAASCIYMCGFQRDFPAAEGQQMPQSWEAEFTRLKQVAIGEEARKRGFGPPSLAPAQPPKPPAPGP